MLFVFNLFLPFGYTLPTISNSHHQTITNNIQIPRDYMPIIHSNKYASSPIIKGPTGIHGFVQKGNDGHFYFEDTTRARFWGVNLVANGINLDQKTIENLTTELAMNGINMIRLHLIDSKYHSSLIDYNSGNSSNLNLEMVNKVDYLIYECGKKGIYIYMDLLDARSFLENEHIVNGSLLGEKAPIVSIFNETLISMQKQYATNLFTHKNPYTNLTYAQDPTIALVEITNENGMIWNPYGGGTGWYDIPEPYQSELKAKWNAWLLARYGNRSELDKAWTSKSGEHALRSYEDPQLGTVELPDVVNGWAYTIYARNYTDTKLGYPRVNDGSIFAYEILKNYFHTMKQHLRDLGVKVPIGASDDQWEIIPPTQRAIKEELDFSAAGYYYDHPQTTSEILAKFTNTPELYTDDDAIAPVVSSQRIAGVPIVVREWNFPYPNDYRSEGTIQMAVFACLQDWDAVILHDLGESYWDLQPNKNLVWWPSHSDPARWPQVRAGALIFLNQLVKPMDLKIDIGYSFTDTFFAQYGYHSWQYSVAPYLGQTRNYFFNSTYDGNADVVIASGRTANASYTSAAQKIILSPWLKYMDLYCKSENISYMAKLLYPSIEVDTSGNPGLGYFTNFAYDSKKVSWTWDGYYPINTSTIPSNLLIFGNTSDEQWAAGFITNNAVIMLSSDVVEATKTLVSDYIYKPNTGGGHNVYEVYRKDRLSARIVVDSFNTWGLSVLNRTDIQYRRWHDADYTWLRDYNNAQFKLNIPEARAIIGFGSGYSAIGDIGIRVDTQHSAVSAIAMDNKPLNQSKHILFTSVANAWNTNQNVTLTYNTTGNYAYSWIKSWSDVGTSPVLYEIFKSTIYLNRYINGTLLLEDIFGNIRKVVPFTNRSEFYIYTLTDSWNITSMEIFEDMNPPTIYNVTAEKWTPEANQVGMITVNVSDAESGLQNVSVIYRKIGGAWELSQMYENSEGLWEGILPGQPYNTIIEFYIYAEDYAEQSVIANNNSAYYKIRWIDTTPPVLKEISWTPQLPEKDENITVNCVIEDNGSDVMSVTLRYQIGPAPPASGSQLKTPIQPYHVMDYDNEIKLVKSNNHYTGTIPAPHQVCTIIFYIIAVDNAGNMLDTFNEDHLWFIYIRSSSNTHNIFTFIQNNILWIAGASGAIIVLIVIIRKRKG